MQRRRLLLAAPLGLSACASLLPSQKYTPRVSWPLQPPPPAGGAAAPGGPVLLVRPISAAPGLEARGLQSLTPDGSLHTDYYNLWAVPPADAVTQALLDWSEASGAFSAVITPGSRLQPGLIVEGELTELLADLGQGEARAALTLVVIKPGAGGTAVPLRQALLRAAMPLTANDPATLARAQSAALAKVLTQAMALLRQGGD